MRQFPWLETRGLRAKGYGPRVYKLMLWRQTNLIRLAYWRSRWVPLFVREWALRKFDKVECEGQVEPCAL